MAPTSGFRFVGLALAKVFYCVSQRLEQHHKLPAIWLPLLSWRANPASLGLFALTRVFEHMGTTLGILVGLFLRGSGIANVSGLLGPAVLLAHRVVGGLLAGMVLSRSVVALPMLPHRKVDFGTAIVTRFLAARLNAPPTGLGSDYRGVDRPVAGSRQRACLPRPGRARTYRDINLLRTRMIALRGVRNPHGLMGTLRFLRAVRIALQVPATIAVAMYNEFLQRSGSKRPGSRLVTRGFFANIASAKRSVRRFN